MFTNALLVLLTLGSVWDKVAAERKLVYVTVLFRHGDRSPIKTYPADPYQEDAWPQGFGQLSQDGMRQHFNLGQFLRKRYNGFLNVTYNRHEISVRSTDYDRTLMSAEANLAALYPPNGQQVFKPDLGWQPIPIHTVPQAQERLLSFPIPNCPRYKQLMNDTEHCEKFLNMTRTYSDFLEMIRNKTGLKRTSVESAWSVYDTLFCELRHNLTTPAWVTADVLERLRTLKDFGFQIIFGVYKHQEKSRLQGGVLLGEIVKNLTKMATPDPDQQLKMMMLSAHDTTIVALQSSLSVFNGRQPPYASCHMIELYREDNGSMSVSMFYRNDSMVPAYQLALPGCTLHCPLEEFVRITQPFIPDDWEKECQVPSEYSDKEVVIALSVASCILLLFLVLSVVILCRRKEPLNSRGYRPMINNEYQS